MDDVSPDSNPTPDQRAELVIRRLEQFIREGRTPYGGMPFKKWQDMAREEIIANILESEKVWRDDEHFTAKVLAAAAAGAVTVGFWGTVMAFGQSEDKFDHGLLLLSGGFLLFAAAGIFAIRKAWKGYKSNRRMERLARVADLDRKLKRLDKDLEKRVKELEKSIDEMMAMKRRRLKQAGEGK